MKNIMIFLLIFILQSQYDGFIFSGWLYGKKEPSDLTTVQKISTTAPLVETTNDTSNLTTVPLEVTSPKTAETTIFNTDSMTSSPPQDYSTTTSVNYSSSLSIDNGSHSFAEHILPSSSAIEDSTTISVTVGFVPDKVTLTTRNTPIPFMKDSLPSPNVITKYPENPILQNNESSEKMMSSEKPKIELKDKRLGQNDRVSLTSLEPVFEFFTNKSITKSSAVTHSLNTKLPETSYTLTNLPTPSSTSENSQASISIATNSQRTSITATHPQTLNPTVKNPKTSNDIEMGSSKTNSKGTNSQPSNNTVTNITATNLIVTNPIAKNPIVTNPIAKNPIATNSIATHPQISNHIETGSWKANSKTTHSQISNPISTNPQTSNTIATNPQTSNDIETGSSKINPIATSPQTSNHIEMASSKINLKATNSQTTNPALTNQIVTNLIATNPIATNPQTSNPIATNPIATNPIATNPIATNPIATTTIATNHIATSLIATNLISTYPIATNPQTSNPIATNPQTSNPIVTNPIATNPIVTNPIATNPIATNPIVTNPIVTNPIATNPQTSNHIEMDSSKTNLKATNSQTTNFPTTSTTISSSSTIRSSIMSPIKISIVIIPSMQNFLATTSDPTPSMVRKSSIYSSIVKSTTKENYLLKSFKVTSFTEKASPVAKPTMTSSIITNSQETGSATKKSSITIPVLNRSPIKRNPMTPSSAKISSVTRSQVTFSSFIDNKPTSIIMKFPAKLTPTVAHVFVTTSIPSKYSMSLRTSPGIENIVRRSITRWFSRNVSDSSILFDPVCTLDLDEGYGSETFTAWYYNSQTRRCEWFNYRGHAGNGNRFNYRANCEHYCLNQYTNLCSRLDIVNCEENWLSCRLDYDQNCHKEADRNNKIRMLFCPPPQPICVSKNGIFRKSPLYLTHRTLIPAECYQKKDPGLCFRNSNSFLVFHYDARYNDCFGFLYSRCGGNSNRFPNKQDCMNHCAV